MRLLIATVFKELLLLSRDKTGLLVLFLMPAVLVIVISLVQENVLKTTGETEIHILFIDHDQQLLGSFLEEHLIKSGLVDVVKSIDGIILDENKARQLLADGKYQFCIVIPEGLTEKVKTHAVHQIIDAFGKQQNTARQDVLLPELTIYFDPAVQGTFRSAIVGAVHRLILMMEIQIKANIIAEILPVQVQYFFQSLVESDLPEFSQNGFPYMDTNWGKQRLLDVQVLKASSGTDTPMPSSVQQNVPAWALFGMFFIVIPLGGSLIRERQHGVFVRLMTLPVPFIILLLGKVMAYVLVCLFQFVVILLVGMMLMPMLGAPTLKISSSLFSIFAVVLSASLAAAGYGVLLGTSGRTYEQISMFGAVSVVIAAAIGGIMVPVYVMPKIMQQISVFSPLAWGLNALTSLFVREGDIGNVFAEIFYLLAFFAGTMLLSWLIFTQKVLTNHMD